MGSCIVALSAGLGIESIELRAAAVYFGVRGEECCMLRNSISRCLLMLGVSGAAVSGGRSGTSADSASEGLGVLWRITRMTFRYRWLLAIGAVAIVLASAFQLYIPIMLGDGIDAVGAVLSDEAVAQGRTSFLAQWALDVAVPSEGGTGDRLTATLLVIAGMILGLSALRGSFTFLHLYLTEVVAQRIGYELRLLYYEKLQRLSFAYHDRIHTGDLLTRGILDIEGVRGFTSRAMLRVVYLVVFVGAGAYLMLSSDLLLGLLSLSFVPFAAWRSILARLQMSVGWRRYQEEMGRLTQVMDENLKGIRVVRSFAAERYELEKYDAISDVAFERAFGLVGVRANNMTMVNLSFLLSMALVILFGGLKVLDATDPFTIGDLAQFLAFLGIMRVPVRYLGMVVAGWAQGATSGRRLFDVLDSVPEIQDHPDAKPLKVKEGVLKFEHVDFAFRDQFGDAQVLKDVSFEARPGHTVGIVGPPGSGKSTLAHLIPRFYDPTAGRILIDGQDISVVTLESLRHAVGVVEQDTFLFTTTIDNNVAYGDPRVPHGSIERATDSAQMKEYVDRLPTGFETLVGERGVTLSGGQRQRLSIARSILLHPQIIVFDDSTAAIDAATEQRIRAALQEVTADRATIIISHRLSSLMHADEILFLEEGAIVERGSHAELLAQQGKYRDLYELQIRPEDDRPQDFEVS